MRDARCPSPRRSRPRAAFPYRSNRRRKPWRRSWSNRVCPEPHLCPAPWSRFVPKCPCRIGANASSAAKAAGRFRLPPLRLRHKRPAFGKRACPATGCLFDREWTARTGLRADGRLCRVCRCRCPTPAHRQCCSDGGARLPRRCRPAGWGRPPTGGGGIRRIGR